MPRDIDDGHRERRAFLRLLGPVLVVAGLVFIVIGIVDVVSAFSSDRTPGKLWYPFAGMALLGIGLTIMKFAYLGAVSRYLANEVAPVGKDVVNYMADGTKDAVRDVATAVGEGLGAARGEQKIEVVRCHKCNQANEATANFCKECGTSLGKTQACPGCGELNDPDARFCDNCGQVIA